MFDVLGLMFLNMRVERLQSFIDQRADLLHDTTRLLDFIHLEIPTEHSKLSCLFKSNQIKVYCHMHQITERHQSSEIIMTWQATSTQ